jgi:orotidine-5'-phosphate decarboxylase
MLYNDLLKHSADKFKSIVCLGLDPEVEKIPMDGKPADKIYTFYESILNCILKKKIFPAAVKPNYAFYAQYGIEGIESLYKIIKLYKKEGFPVILDAKRGDIGKTAEAYAREAFSFFDADAVTLSPYMGNDSVSPYLNMYPDRGCYILTKTSNPGSGDLQDILFENKPVFIRVAEKITEWYKSGMGAVAGATFPEQLVSIQEVFLNSGKEIPLLIPGVGTQGGDVKTIVKIISENKEFKIHRINSSSAINYAYIKKKNLKFDEAAVEALNELNGEISLF